MRIIINKVCRLRSLALSLLLLLAATIPAAAQMISVGYTDRLSDDRLILCGKGNPLDKEAIDELLTDGLGVVSLGYTDSGWAIAMANGTGYYDQILHHSSAYPKDWIENHIKSKYAITALACGPDGWWVVMSKGSPFEQQHIIGAPSWETTAEAIDYDMSMGQYITGATYGQGKWTVVMSPCRIYTKQVYFKTRDTQSLSQQIRDYWKKGYAVTNLSAGAGEVLCVMSAVKSGSLYDAEDLGLVLPRNFRNTLRDYWDQGYHIINICNGGN